MGRIAGAARKKSTDRRTGQVADAGDTPPVAVPRSRRGDEVHARILAEALKAFGRHGFRGATTRQIAEAAQVNLPALQYYFGGKEGLYRACACEVVRRYLEHVSGPALESVARLKGDLAPGEARALLKAVMRALAGFLIGSEEAQAFGPFVAQEVSNPGAGFDILFKRLWEPGIGLIADLIGRITRNAERAPARVHAILLLSGLIAFHKDRSVSLKALGWRRLGAEEREIVIAALETQIDAIGRG